MPALPRGSNCPSSPRTSSIAYCGQGAIVGIAPDDREVVIIPLRCKQWDCPTCGSLKAFKTAAKIATGSPNKFLTLTLDPKFYHTTALALDHLKRSFSKLVRLIRKQFGPFHYAAVLELQKSGMPHYHICARSKYIPQRWLSVQWQRLTRATNVDIRAVKNQSKVASYLCKYLAKTATATVQVLNGRRLVQFSAAYLPDDRGQVADADKAVWTWTWYPAAPWRVFADLPFALRNYPVTIARSGVVTLTRPAPGEPPALPWCVPDTGAAGADDALSCPRSDVASRPGVDNTCPG